MVLDWLAYGLGAATLLGSGNFLGGRAARLGSAPTVVALASHGLGAVLLVAVVIVSGSLALSTADVGVAALGGIASAAATVLLYRALRVGLMSVNAPVMGVTSIFTATVAGALQGDSLSSVALLGIILAGIAVVATSQSSVRRGARVTTAGLPEAVGAGAGFGIFSVCLASSAAGAAETLLVARVVSAALLLGAVAWGGRPVAIGRSVRAGVVVGGFEFVGNILMFSALAAGSLAVVQALLALNPVVTILLARFAFREHLNRWQHAGSASAIVSIVFLALG